jgi:hypothetical protein
MKRISTALGALGTLGCCGIALGLVAGCVTTETKTNSAPAGVPVVAPPVTDTTAHKLPVIEAPPNRNEEPRQVHFAWEGHVIQTRDTENGGRPLPGIAGRMYLFGDDVGFPLLAAGDVQLEMFDVKQDGKLVKLAEWNIDGATLARLTRRDGLIGWGYTLFLPWETYNPAVKKVQIQGKFMPKTGTALLSPPALVTLRQDDPPTLSSRQVPVSAKK